MKDEKIVVVLEWNGVEIKKMRISRLMTELQLPVASPFPEVITEEVPSTSTLHKLVFRYKGKQRLCECERHTIPIYEFEGVE